MHYYGITIKATSKANKKKGIEVLKQHLNKIINYTGSQLFDEVYELDSKNLVHLHGTILSKILINPLVFIERGIHCRFVKCNNIDGWLSYCQKDKIPLPHEVMDFFRNNYGFI